MTPDEQIAVIQARARGEKIECKYRSADAWKEALLDFDFFSFDYRIAKPVPKKMKMLFATEEDANKWQRFAGMGTASTYIQPIKVPVCTFRDDEATK